MTGEIDGEAAPVTAVIEFDGRRLVFRDGEIAMQLASDLRSLQPVDLAGHWRPVGGYPTIDPSTGELHLIASPGGWSSTHQVISRHAMTRRSRPLLEAPAPVHHLTVTATRLVLFAEGATGFTARDRMDTDDIRWFSTRTVPGGDVVAARDDEESVVIVVAGRSLERWRLDGRSGAVERVLVSETALDQSMPRR